LGRGTFSISNDDDHPPNKCAILTVATIIKAVMTLAAEAELGAIYLNAKKSGIPWSNNYQNGPSTTTNTYLNQ
jgi:hypothetical protein